MPLKHGDENAVCVSLHDTIGNSCDIVEDEAIFTRNMAVSKDIFLIPILSPWEAGLLIMTMETCLEISKPYIDTKTSSNYAQEFFKTTDVITPQWRRENCLSSVSLQWHYPIYNAASMNLDL